MYLNFLRKDFKNKLNRTNKTKLKSPIQLFFLICHLPFASVSASPKFQYLFSSYFRFCFILDIAHPNNYLLKQSFYFH